VQSSQEVTQRLIENGNIVSVGYMLRYLRCVQKMKQIIHENNLTVMATNARYVSTDDSASLTVVLCVRGDRQARLVEQGYRHGTGHRARYPFLRLVSILRWRRRYQLCCVGRWQYIADNSARSIEHYEAPGKLSKIPIDESKIPEELRIPRLTSAVWKYENGAVGSFTHAVALQGHAYACELEVWADGYHMRLVDPYNAPTLFVRRPGDDHEERHTYTDDDPFFSEVSSFIDCIEGGPDPHILSSFEDATKTYE